MESSNRGLSNSQQHDTNVVSSYASKQEARTQITDQIKENKIRLQEGQAN